MSELVERIKNLKKYSIINAKIEISHSAKIIEKELMYLDCLNHNGYITECGAWSLYNIPGTKEKCYSALFGEKENFKEIRLKIGFELKDFIKIEDIKINTFVLTKTKLHTKLSKDTNGKLVYVKFVNKKQIEQLKYEDKIKKIKLVDMREK